jgi:hypothetical protein
LAVPAVPSKPEFAASKLAQQNVVYALGFFCAPFTRAVNPKTPPQKTLARTPNPPYTSNHAC